MYPIKKNFIFSFGIIFYISVLIFLYFFPLNFNGIIISYTEVCCDYNYHRNFGIYISDNYKDIFTIILKKTFNFWTKEITLIDDNDFYPGIIYPLTLNLISYFDIKFLDTFIALCFTILTLYNFIKILSGHKFQNLKLFLIILIPYQLYFTIFFPSDILFSYLISLYLYEISKEENLNYNNLLVITFLLIFCKPNGLISLIFTIFIFLKRKKFFNFSLIFLILLFILGFLYYGPYIISYFQVSSDPSVINNSYLFSDIDLSSTEYFIAELINYYFRFFNSLGIRYSQSGNDMVAIFRIIFGICFFIGFVWSLINYKNYINLFIIFYFFLGITGMVVERYFFFFYPVLMINFVDIVGKLFFYFKKYKSRLN